MKTISTRIALSLATVMLLGASATTFAAPVLAPVMAKKTVRYADLDIATADGAHTLYERIQRAANFVCRHEYAPLAFDCRAEAVDNAVKDVGSSLLASIHRSVTGRTEEVVVR